jgi:DNA polymerase-3 subunit delta'
MEILRFSEIMGQDLAVGILRRAASSQRIPHSYLFTGLPGVGKSATARAFALYLNCEGPVGGEACGICRSCRKMKSDNFPDFKEISPEKGVIKIEKVRELISEFQYPPLEGRFRFTLVREAERMTIEAANAFLKTLEEPPVGNILIMTAVEPLGLLPTVVSRCRRVPFKPVGAKEIEFWLRKRNLGFTEVEMRTAASLSMGSPGRAVRILESSYLQMRRDWINKAVALPTMGYNDLMDLAEEMSELDKKQLLDPSEGGTSALNDMLAFFAVWFRDMLVVKRSQDQALIINIDGRDELRKASEVFTEQSLLDIIFFLHAAAAALVRNRNARLVGQKALVFIRDRAHRKEYSDYGQ